jgi:hypothetical protein
LREFQLIEHQALWRSYEIAARPLSKSYPFKKILMRRLRDEIPSAASIGRTKSVKLVEPPSCSSLSSIVFIGKNHRGQWIAQEQNGLYGGLFVSRAQAIKYALFENGQHPETIVELPREIELDMGRHPDLSQRAA